MAISRKWKLITGLNLLLLASALVFALIEWRNYDIYIYGFQGADYGDGYWLHPDNKHVESLQYIRQFSGYLEGLLIGDDNTMTVVLEGRLQSITHIIREGRVNNYYLDVSDIGVKRLSKIEFFNNITIDRRISYSCEVENGVEVLCQYFLI